MSTTRLIPTARQLEFQDWEFGLFLHFGIRTFYEGARDWDDTVLSPAQFNPTQLDCDQWCRVAAEAGARYMVLTAKHHDGFANWPSRYTDFGVRSSPWQGGQGDVVREFVDACATHHIRPGLYYSPAQHDASGSDVEMADARAYDDFFIRQVSELLDGTYGSIDMLWFDGCGSENHTYDWARIIGEIRQMQPGILIFNMGDPDYRWVGNEAGVAPNPCFNVTDRVPLSVNTTDEPGVAQPHPIWLPAECDCRLRDLNWFYQEADTDTVKSVPELMGMWDYSVGRGANLLLNVGPDRRGLLPELDTTRLLEFARARSQRFADPFAPLDAWVREGDTWIYEPTPKVENQHSPFFFVNQAILMEELTRGEFVERFRIRVVPWSEGNPITVYEGQHIGHRAICSFPLIRTHKVTLELICADGHEAALRSIALHHVQL